MSAVDFALLRGEGRSLASAARECLAEYDYTNLEADVTIDGVFIPQVEIRKKGFLGSINRARPSLKFDFDEFVDDRTYNEMSRMTLNNNYQDPGAVRQCMSYDLFRKAGLVAPRCNFARVTVNGEDLGIYTNVEPIKKPFLTLNYGDKSGNLYEAQLADFGSNSSDKFEKKTNSKENDRTDLDAVAQALQMDDANLVATLSQYVDVDEFIRFWAMETVLGHWDSATGHGNNFYIYRNPADNLFHYIPWGADGSFTGTHLLFPDSGLLYRNNNIASRLYAIPEYKAKYFTAINDLLDTLWDEDQLVAEVERIELLTGTDPSENARIRTFIAWHRNNLQNAMAGYGSATEHLISNDVMDCSPPPVTDLTVDMEYFGGTFAGSFSFTDVDGTPVNAFILSGYSSYESHDSTSPGNIVYTLVGWSPVGTYAVNVYIEGTDYVPGDHDFQGWATSAVLVDTTNGITVLAYGDTGTTTLNYVGSGGDVDMDLTTTMEFDYDIYKE